MAPAPADAGAALLRQRLRARGEMLKPSGGRGGVGRAPVWKPRPPPLRPPPPPPSPRFF